MNQWGSGRGNAKGCRQITRLFLLFPESILPVVLNIPPSSYKASHSYALALAAYGIDPITTTTRISLVKAKNAEGIEYSEVHFARGVTLDDATVTKLRAYREQFLPAITGMAVDTEV
jgi:hypothetical protein